MIIEIKEHSFFENLLSEENTIIDLGACRGEFIKEFISKYNTKKCIAVEPNPTNFVTLPNSENIIKYNNLISSVKGEERIFFEDTKSPYNGSTIFNYFNGVQHIIKTITLDEILVENKIDYVDLLKIDIEGSEYELLESLTDSFFNKVRQITIEFHDFVEPKLKERTEEIIKRIENLGFNRISKPIKYMYNSEHYDVLFYKK